MDKTKLFNEIKLGNIDCEDLSEEELQEVCGGMLDDPSTYISSDPKDIYTFREQPIKKGDYVQTKGSHIFKGMVFDIRSGVAFICSSLPFIESNTFMYPVFRLERYAGNRTIS